MNSGKKKVALGSLLLRIATCQCTPVRLPSISTAHGRMRILAAIHPPDTTRKILEHLGLPSRAPPIAPAVSEPEPAALEADFID